jgi:hypothetical protein
VDAPFGLNVVSRDYRVDCISCGAIASRVGIRCNACGVAFPDGGFRIRRVAGSRLGLVERLTAAFAAVSRSA